MSDWVQHFCAQHGMHVQNNSADGNCATESVEQWLRHTRRSPYYTHQQIRQMVFDYAMDPKNGRIYGDDTMISHLHKDGEYWGDGMLSAAAHCLKVDIILITNYPACHQGIMVFSCSCENQTMVTVPVPERAQTHANHICGIRIANSHTRHFDYQANGAHCLWVAYCAKNVFARHYQRSEIQQWLVGRQIDCTHRETDAHGVVTETDQLMQMAHKCKRQVDVLGSTPVSSMVTSVSSSLLSTWL